MATSRLAAIYTDSEDSQDEGDKKIEQMEVDIHEEANNDREVIHKEIRSLVSYLDETLESEEEGAQEVLERASEVNTLSWSEGKELPGMSTFNTLGADFMNSAVPNNILPPEPRGTCSEYLQRRVEQFSDKMSQNGSDINELIQHRKNFRNPSIYEKMVQYCSIDEFGTNYHSTQYDPRKWGSESFYESLRKAQDQVMKKRMGNSTSDTMKHTGKEKPIKNVSFLAPVKKV